MPSVRPRNTAHVGLQKHIKDGTCLLVNPGSVAAIDAPGIDAIPTWILGDLSNMRFEIRTLKLQDIAVK